MPSAKTEYKFRPLTYKTWKDIEILFGDRGACAGCWCMYWRQTHKDFAEKKGEKNKAAFKKLVKRNAQTGIVAYSKNVPVGWIAFAPREQYIRLESSRILKIVDEKPVWSVVCFFIDKNYRRKGLTVELLNEAAEHSKKNGGKILEGYPVDPGSADYVPTFAYTGLASAFRKAGFTEVRRRSETRPIMRKVLK